MVALNGYNAATDTAKSWYGVERGQRFVHEPWVLGGRGFNAKAIASHRTVLVNRDMAAALREVGAQPLPGESPKSGVWVPLLAGGEPRGVITLQNLDREDAFSEADVRLLETLAASMSVALENARLFDETQRRARESAALAEVGRELSSSLELTAVMNCNARHAKDLLAAGNGAIFLPQHDQADGRSHLAIVALGDLADTLKATAIEAGKGIIGELLQSGQAEFINDTGSDAPCPSPARRSAKTNA